MKLDLATLKKRLQTRSVIAVTLESGRIAVDLLKRDEGGSNVVRSFSVPIGAEAVLADAEKAGQALGEQLAAAGIRERKCVVCVPAGWALTTSTEVPGMEEGDLRGYLELRAEREFPIPVADLRISHCSYTLPDGTIRATLAAIPTKRAEAVEKMLAAAGCRAVSLSLGLDECMPAPESPASLHFLANGNHVDVVIAAGGGIAALRSLPGAAGANAANFDAVGFSREVRITLGRLPEMVRQQVREALFSGAPDSAENLCIEIRQYLHRMGIDSRLERPAYKAGVDHPAAGLAAAQRHLQQESVAFEFLPPQVNRWQEMATRFDSRGRRWMIGAGIALVVLPLFVFFVRSRIESSLQSEWDGMKDNVAKLESLQQSIRRFRPWFENAPLNLQALEGLTESFPEQGEVWAKTVQINEDYKVTCSGFAQNQQALLATLGRLRARPDVTAVQVQSVRGEKPVQFSFTYKWIPRDAK